MERYRIKILFTAVTLILSAISIYPQPDTSIFFKKADFSFFKFKNVKYQSSSEIQIEKYKTSLDDVTALSILSSDSVRLFKNDEIPAYTSLPNIDEVQKYKYRFSPFLGTIIGVIGGGIIGTGIGYLASGKQQTSEGYLMLEGGFLGAILGGFFGAGITYSINHPTLDLSSVPDKDKRNKLIKFLKEK